MHFAPLQEGHVGCVGVDVMRLDAGAFVQRHSFGGIARFIKIAGNLGLAVYRYMPSGQSAEVDPLHSARRGDDGTFVHLALGVDAFADTCLLHQRDGAGLKNARPDSGQYVLACSALQKDRIDPVGVQKLRI